MAEADPGCILKGGSELVSGLFRADFSCPDFIHSLPVSFTVSPFTDGLTGVMMNTGQLQF